eukprot:scaffold54619_cov63-Phaeocystis_antarctica.AAC.4
MGGEALARDAGVFAPIPHHLAQASHSRPTHPQPVRSTVAPHCPAPSDPPPPRTARLAAAGRPWPPPRAPRRRVHRERQLRPGTRCLGTVLRSHAPHRRREARAVVYAAARPPVASAASACIAEAGAQTA